MALTSLSLFLHLSLRVRDRKVLVNALTVDPLYLQHSQSGRWPQLQSILLLTANSQVKFYLGNNR